MSGVSDIQDAAAEAGASAAGDSSSSDSKSDRKKKGRDQTDSQRGASTAGKSLQSSSLDMIREAGSRDTRERNQSAPRYVDVPSFKRGGTKRKAGVARLHKGEKIKRGKKRGAKAGRY